MQSNRNGWNKTYLNRSVYSFENTFVKKEKIYFINIGITSILLKKKSGCAKHFEAPKTSATELYQQKSAKAFADLTLEKRPYSDIYNDFCLVFYHSIIDLILTAILWLTTEN